MSMPEALQLAHWLENELDPHGTVRFVAATELRKLLAERDRYRDALIACRPAVVRDLDRYSLMNATEGSRRLSAILDTIDAAAKGQG